MVNKNVEFVLEDRLIRLAGVGGGQAFIQPLAVQGRKYHMVRVYGEHVKLDLWPVDVIG